MIFGRQLRARYDIFGKIKLAFTIVDIYYEEKNVFGYLKNPTAIIKRRISRRQLRARCDIF